jgi:hypothetical protein
MLIKVSSTFSTLMSVIPITVFFSLGLAFIFIALFWREQRRHRFASSERDSLLPLAEETPHLVARPATRDHHCGCERGAQPPCAGCRTPPASPTV